MAPTAPLRSLDEAQRWLSALVAAPHPRAIGDWPLASVLDHLAQSAEMSMDGYPQPRSVLFQRTAGRLAFSLFKLRGRMRHSLSAPIPGAPPLLGEDALAPATMRLRVAIARFEQHQGPLQPHFAYGPLDKADYTQAHLLHIADHQQEIVTD
jgi:hypothetical protein